MSSGSTPPRVTAFVGRSFLPDDDGLWQEIRELLEALRPFGFVFEDAKEPQPRPVSEKVREGINRNDLYVGVLSRRAPIQSPGLVARLSRTSRWATSTWVVQESGYALGRDKRVLLLIEEGIDFPTANLDADTEWIAFKRGAVVDIAPRLTAMIGHFIAEKLPAVTAAATGESVVVSPPQDAAAAAVATTPDLGDVLALLNAKKVLEADEALERFLAPLPKDDDFAKGVPYYYLWQKAIRGISGALDELQRKLNVKPEDIHARIQLARYYSHFKNYKEAAKVVADGLQTAANRWQKRTLLRRLAVLLAQDGNSDEALRTATMLFEEPEPDEVAGNYETLADVAKAFEMSELEAAALEAALASNPSDQSWRFRLAYLYGQSEKQHRMAAYHYKLRLAQGHDATSLNNLAVSYAPLKLSSLEINAFERAESDSRLARANLAHAYIDRGFLAKGEELASRVLAEPGDDDTERGRATGALQRATHLRRSEKESEEKILEAARAESAFRARYAAAYVDKAPATTDGFFDTPHGRIAFTRIGNDLKGEASSVIEARSVLAALATPGSAQQKREQAVTYVISLVAGRAANLTVTVTGHQPAGLLLSFPDVKTIKGLAIIENDGGSFEALEEGDDGGRIYIARKVTE